MYSVYYDIFTFQAKLLTLPQVFITPEIDPRLAVKLKDIVKRHNVRIHMVSYTKINICKCIDIIQVLHIGLLTKQEVKMSSSKVQSWPTCTCIFMQDSKPISALFTKHWWIRGLFACISDMVINIILYHQNQTGFKNAVYCTWLTITGT